MTHPSFCLENLSGLTKHTFRKVSQFINALFTHQHLKCFVSCIPCIIYSEITVKISLMLADMNKYINIHLPNHNQNTFGNVTTTHSPNMMEND